MANSYASASAIKAAKKTTQGLIEGLEIEIGRARRHARPLCLAAVRIEIADAARGQGYDASRTNVFQRLEACAADLLRRHDFFGRPRETTFAIVLPETNQAGGEIVLSKLMKDPAVTAAVTRADKILKSVDVAAVELNSEINRAEVMLAAIDAAFHAP